MTKAEDYKQQGETVQSIRIKNLIRKAYGLPQIKI